jgi:hypothetical protein
VVKKDARIISERMNKAKLPPPPPPPQHQQKVVAYEPETVILDGNGGGSGPTSAIDFYNLFLCFRRHKPA